MSDYDKFITPNFNRVKHGNGPFTTVDDKPVPHPSTQMQDSNNNISPISLAAIGIGMLSIVTMLVVRLRRGLQPATALGDNLMEMKSQDSNVKVNSGRVGWGQLSSQSPQTLTPCYASKQEMAALAEANPDFLGKSFGHLAMRQRSDTCVTRRLSMAGWQWLDSLVTSRSQRIWSLGPIPYCFLEVMSPASPLL